MTHQILPLAKELISINSVAGETDKLVEILEVAKKHLAGYEFTSFTSNNIPSLLYSNKGKDVKNFKIILNAHLDIVPGTPDQFIPYEKDGKLFGRGAYDMKSSAAVMIHLFKEIGKSLPYSLGLQLTTDEETGGGHGTNHQLEKGVRAEFAIMGEGTGFRLVHEAKAIIIAKIKVKGKAAHSAYPWLGENAIWHMQEVLSNVIKYFPIPTKETHGTTVTITNIETNNMARNVVPAECTAYLNIRYVAKDRDTIIPTLQSLLPQGVTLEILNKDTIHYSDPNSFNILHLKKVGEEILNTTVPLSRAHGASDARYFSRVDCNAIEFGPVGQGHHGAEEWVDTESLLKYHEILKKFLLSIK